jgi:hypothetical protein
MQAAFISDPEGAGEDWLLIGSRGCCGFVYRFEEGNPVIELSTGCHACVNEINDYALERAIPIRRGAPRP